jgi:hypothetical protein
MNSGVEVKVMYVKGESAIVMYSDSMEKMPQACIIDRQSIGQALPGATVYIAGDAIARSTPYGLDWSVFFPDGLVISPQDIQKVMYSQGIISLDDLKTRASEIPSIIAHLSTQIGIQLYNLVKKEVGG